MKCAAAPAAGTRRTKLQIRHGYPPNPRLVVIFHHPIKKNRTLFFFRGLFDKLYIHPKVYLKSNQHLLIIIKNIIEQNNEETKKLKRNIFVTISDGKIIPINFFVFHVKRIDPDRSILNDFIN